MVPRLNGEQFRNIPRVVFVDPDRFREGQQMPSTATNLLKTYRQKRDFRKTAEPSGKGTNSAGAKALSFVVQKHDATRLHYDFRLELDGVLKSWAVTRGPSTDPADKRLAVRVEDHPLDYGGFEGTIPEGQYGGGTVMLWDEGTWEPLGDPHQGLEDGDLKFRLNGKRMKGEWVLVYMKGRDRSGKQQWLLIKHADEFATPGDSHLTDEFTTSVETGRDLDGIAKSNKPRKRSAPALAATPSVHSLHKVLPARSIAPERPKRLNKPRGRTMDLSNGVAEASKVGIELTHPDRAVYDKPEVTKAELAAYYAAVADRMLPFIADRPLSLLRCPQGQAHHCFFQKHDTGGFPAAMKSVKITEKDGTVEDYFYIQDLAGLIGGVQMNVLEFHLWGSKRDNVEKPERIIFDLDPDEGLGFTHVRDAAADIRKALGDLGLESFAMLTGGKGIHVIAPLQPSLEWPEVKAFCHGFAQTLEAREPERFVTNMAKVKRKGRMFVDYLRNERGATAVSPWSTRSRAGAPVAVPIGWSELKKIEAANSFSLADAAARASKPDPWKGYFALKQTITAAMLEAVGGAKT